MERRDMSTGQTNLFYFINNAQGTPVLIVDEQNNAISKINLDEWGNVGDKTTGPQQEINYTGKKLDIPTRLYYFNQRYYDPEIGRFVNEDPAGQGMNHYAYCGNNPLMYTDPDGQFFGWDDMIYAAVAYASAKTATKFVDNLAHGRSNDLTSLGDTFKDAAVESLKKQTGFDKVEDAYNKAKDAATMNLPKIELPSVKLPNISLPNNPQLPNGINIPPGVNLNLNIKIASAFSFQGQSPLCLINLPSFYLAVKTGGPWDYKQFGPRYEPFGNFHYGVVGRAAGYPRQVLLRAAGFYQEYRQKYDPKNGHPWGNSPYGDNKEDQINIEKGMDYYDTYYGNN